MTDAVHRNGGYIFAQLNHFGVNGSTTSMDDYRVLWSASNVKSPAFGEMAKAVEPEDMEELRVGWVRSAEFAKAAGFDGVEVHLAHSYLLEQFISPLFNKRTDEYGGSLENRLRFPREVIARVREAVGPDFPLMQDPNGVYTFDEALRVGRILDELDFYWFEEPIRDQQRLLLRQLQQSVRTPLLVGETCRFADFHLNLCDGVFPLVRGDALIKGGVMGLRKLMAAAETFGVDLEIHTANTPLIDIAQLHVACACQNTRFIENHHPIFRFGIKDNPLEADANGNVEVPEKPGLGVDLDWDWIDDHTAAVR